MSKQKGNYNVAHIRPTSYSKVRTSQDFDKNGKKSLSFFSNLLHNYEKVSKKDGQTHRITFLNLRRGDSCKIKPIQMELTQLQRKLPFQHSLLAQKNSLSSERQRLSNYSLYLERSIDKKARRISNRCISTSRAASQFNRSELLQPCKISPIKIQTRGGQSEILKGYKDVAESVRRRNRKGNMKMESELNIFTKMGSQMIQPWSQKNYESIIL